MSTVREARPVAPPGDAERSGPVPKWLMAAAFIAIAMGVVLRFITRSELWLDEALSVNIAALPVGDISDALRQDGAPPLYYVLLHYWMEVFGDGDFAVRALSGMFSVATLPAVYFAGRRLGGRTIDDATHRLVAWIAVTLVATSPFAITYATEARMYALEMFFVVLGFLALCRALERPTLIRLGCVAVVTSLLLYTQYWSNYLVAVVGLGLVVYAWQSTGPPRRAALGCIIAIAAGCITFLPWLDTFLYQASHTGTPWGESVLPPTAFSMAVEDFGGGDHWESIVVQLPLVLLAVLAVVGMAIDRFRIQVDLRTRPGVRLVALCAVLTLGLGATAAWLAPDGTFEGRYASVVFPLFMLMVAFGFLCLTDTRIKLGLLAAIAVLGLISTVQRNTLDERTQATEIAASITADAEPGDVVVYCPDQLGPAVSRLLDGEDLQQITFPDGGSPEFVDWVDYLERNQAADPNVVADEAIELAGPDGTVWLVSAAHYRGLEGKCEALSAALAAQRPTVEQVVLPNDEFFEFEGLIRYLPG